MRRRTCIRAYRAVLLSHCYWRSAARRRPSQRGRVTRTGSVGNAARAAQRSRQRPHYLEALEEFDQVALLSWPQTEVEAGIVVADHIQECRETAVVEEAALRPSPEAFELRRDHGAADRPLRSTVGLEGVDTHFGRRMRVVAGVSVERRHMAFRAFALAAEDRLTTFRRSGVEAAHRRLRCLQRELVVVERGQLRRHLVGVMAEFEKAASDRRRVLGRIVEPLVVEVSVAVHLEVGDVGVPVGDVAEAARPCVEILAEMAVGGRDPDRGRLAVRPETDGVNVDLGVVEAGAPAKEHLLERVDRHWVARPEDLLGRRSQVGRERDDQTGVQVLVRPAVQSLADSRGERVVDGRMANGAGDADRSERTALVEEALDAEDSVQLQKGERGRRTVEVDLAELEAHLEVPREGIDVDFQAGDGKGRLRADTGPNASEGGALDRLVQPERAAPVVLVAEGVEAEDRLALLEQRSQSHRAPSARLILGRIRLVDRLQSTGTEIIVVVQLGARNGVSRPDARGDRLAARYLGISHEPADEYHGEQSFARFHWVHRSPSFR